MQMDFESIRQAAVEQGWIVERTRGKHWRFVPPDKTKKMVVTGGTPSDVRATRNLLADLRRQGLQYRLAA